MSAGGPGSARRARRHWQYWLHRIGASTCRPTNLSEFEQFRARRRHLASHADGPTPDAIDLVDAAVCGLSLGGMVDSPASGPCANGVRSRFVLKTICVTVMQPCTNVIGLPGMVSRWMHPSRRKFLQTLSAGAVAAGLPRWAYARTSIRRVSRRRPPRSEISRLVVRGARRRPSGSAVPTPTSVSPATARRTSPYATARSCARRGGGGFGPGGDATETYGFGVRVIHGGVWGFASSPLVTPDEIKRVTGVATDVARASASPRSATCSSRRPPAYDEFWQVPIQKDPWGCRSKRRSIMLRGVTATMQKNSSVLFAVASVGFEHEWKYLATSEGSFIEQVFHFTNCNPRRDRAHRQPGEDPQLRAPCRQRRRVLARPICRATPSASRPKPSSTRWPSPSARG